jgi:hypothetical protein
VHSVFFIFNRRRSVSNYGRRLPNRHRVHTKQPFRLEMLSHNPISRDIIHGGCQRTTATT